MYGPSLQAYMKKLKVEKLTIKFQKKEIILFEYSLFFFISRNKQGVLWNQRILKEIKIMVKNLTNKENDRLNKIMKDRVDLITELLREEKLEYAKIETNTLKKYLDRQYKNAKKNARRNRGEFTVVEEIES